MARRFQIINAREKCKYVHIYLYNQFQIMLMSVKGVMNKVIYDTMRGYEISVFSLFRIIL